MGGGGEDGGSGDDVGKGEGSSGDGSSGKDGSGRGMLVKAAEMGVALIRAEAAGVCEQ